MKIESDLCIFADFHRFLIDCWFSWRARISEKY